VGLLARGETTDQPPVSSPPTGQAKAGYPYVGEITGDSVYVRCHPDQNWYPTTKLSRGDRIEVHDEQFGWLKIRPPRGSFCYVDKGLLVRDAADKGVVTGDNVYVRAGSDVPEYARKKTGVVTQLNKGAEVKILGEHPDGYYKIAPPKDAYYWISQQFVRRVGGGALAEGEGVPTRVEPATPRTETVTKKESRGPAEPSVSLEAAESATTQPGEPTRLVDVWQKRLELVDAELKAALRQRPLREADFQSLRKQFEPIAEQSDEEVPKEYAKIRLQQIDDVLERIAIRARIDDITRGMAAERRAQVTATASAPVSAAFRPDYEGKLVRSFAFENRYRIVDVQDGKTLAYLEFPPGSGFDPSQYVGRYVKVRVKQKRYDSEARRSVIEPAEIVTGDAELGSPTAPVGPPVPSATANQPAAVDSSE